MATRSMHVLCALVPLLVMGCAVDAAEPTEGREQTAEVSDAVIGVDTFLYFRCNSTSWDVDDASRVRSTDAPGEFVLHYNVTEDWMMTDGDPCIFTETNQLNGWGTQQTFFSARDTTNGTLGIPAASRLLA